MTDVLASPKLTSFLRFTPAERAIYSAELSAKNGVDTWVVLGNMFYYVGQRDEKNWIQIPKGYRITGAKVPRFMRSWLKPCEQGGQAAILHNYLRETGKGKFDGIRRKVTKKEADRIFLEAMRVVGIPLFKRWALYAGAALTK